MIRTLILGAVTAASVGLGGSALAHEPARGLVSGFHPPQGYDRDFVVYVAVRHHDHIHWERYGRYETYHEAKHAERRLEREGYRVRIDEVRDRRPW
jgi:hypothetical protein